MRSTIIVLLLVAAAPLPVAFGQTYDFGRLSEGPLAEQDGWKMFRYGPADANGIAPQLPVSHTNQIVKAGPPISSPVMDAQTIGWLYRVNDDKFAFKIGDPNRVTIQCDMLETRSDSRGHIKFYLASKDHANSAWIGFAGKDFEYREAHHGVTITVPRTFDDADNGVNDWYRLKLDMDFASDRATVSYMNLTDGDTDFLPIPKLTDIQLSKEGQKPDPSSWDRLFVRTNYDAREDPQTRQITNLVVASGKSEATKVMTVVGQPGPKGLSGPLTLDRAKELLVGHWIPNIDATEASARELSRSAREVLAVLTIEFTGGNVSLLGHGKPVRLTLGGETVTPNESYELKATPAGNVFQLLMTDANGVEHIDGVQFLSQQQIVVTLAKGSFPVVLDLGKGMDTATTSDSGMSVADITREGKPLHYKGTWDWDPRGVSTLTLDISNNVLAYTYADLTFSLAYTLKDDASGNAMLNIILPDGNHAEFRWLSRDTVKGGFWLKGNTTSEKPATQITMKRID